MAATARLAPTVEIIPATIFTDVSSRRKKLRVAAYCRVSTDSDDQLQSYETQVRHYTAEIKKNPDWINVGIFADEGITGVMTKKRDEFNKMIELCRAGKIDRILTKSTSRFARNTVDKSFDHLGDYTKAQHLITKYLREWSQIKYVKDNGYFGTTPFFLSFVDAPEKLRKAQYHYLMSLCNDYMQKDDEAKVDIETSISLNNENLFGLYFNRFGFLK